MIPNKIYIPTEYTDNDITPVGVTLQQIFPNDVCYIRKDTLLEWLGKQIEYAKDERIMNKYILAYKDIIEKINSL